MGRPGGLAAAAVVTLALAAALSVPAAPSVFARAARPAAMTETAGSSAPLPGVGHDARFRHTRCPNPIVPGVPQLNLGPNFKCGYLTVPENRFKPKGRKIQIAVAIAAAATPHPRGTPLVWLEGGPGGTGLAVANRVVSQGINADRQIIFIDQRGTLKAKPLLNCPGYDRFLDRTVALTPENPATGRKDAAAVGACYRHWAARGFDLSAFNTPENAADVADLRIALHIKSWNVYGVSYGTDLALQYLRDYPAGIRTEVLDSVVPQQVNLVNGFWATAASGYRAMFGACAARPACHAAYPHLWRDLTTAVNRLSRKPLTVRVLNPATRDVTRVVFDGFQFANLLIVLSLFPGSLVQVPALVHEMAHRDAAQAALRLLATVPPPGLTGYGLAFGVFCSEDVPFTTPAKALAAARKALPRFPARVLALPPQIPHLFADCKAWPVKPASPAVRAPVHSTIPVLEFHGTFDAITSAAWARLVAKNLPHARIITFPGVGHDVVNWSQCAANIMVGFLNHPHGGYRTGCAARLPA